MHRRAHRPARAAQAGFALVEVLVSAVVLLAATGATLSLMDGSEDVQSASRARVAMADLAEQDQERMRATSVIQLGKGTTTTRQEQVGDPPISYTIESKTQTIKDGTSAGVTCTANDAQADYVQITSTVTPDTALPGVNPVQVVSLVIPKAGAFGGTGTLAVPVKTRDNLPQKGIVVAVSGPRSDTAVTNADGCAIFNFLPSGSYLVKLGTSGYVNKLSQSTYTISGTVTTGVVNTTADQAYDIGASITGTFTTVAPGSSTVTATKALSLTVANSGVPNPTGGFVTNAVAAAPGDASITDVDLFPFANGWSVYAGSCAANNPATYSAPTVNAVSNPGGSATVNVRVPTVRLTNMVTSPTKVVLTSTDSGCSQKFTFTDPNAMAVPYGNYRICVQNGASTPARKTGDTVSVNAAGGVTKALTATQDSGVCT